MGDGIQITRVAKRFSSHTQARSRTRGSRTFQDDDALRERLIAALVEVVSDGDDPRLIESRAQA
jgi:hypothetical protein